MGDDEPAAQAKPAKPRAPTWGDLWAYLDQRIETLAAMNKALVEAGNAPYAPYVREIAVLEKLHRLVEIVQLCEADFLRMLERNAKILGMAKPAAKPQAPTRPTQPDGETGGGEQN